MLPTPVLLVDEGQMGKKNLFAGVQILIQSLVKVGISSMVISEPREQINGQFQSLQNFQQNFIQIIKFFTFHGKDGNKFHMQSNYFQSTFPPSTGCMYVVQLLPHS